MIKEGSTLPKKLPPKDGPVQELPKFTKLKFSMDGLAGGWIPYGGGPFMCPGRHFAKQESIGSFAVFWANYEAELQTPSGFCPEPGMKFFVLGALPPKDRTPFRVTRPSAWKA